MKNDIVKLGLILFVICLIAAGLLAVTNSITSPIISQNKLQNEISAKQYVLPQATEFKDIDKNKLQEIFKNSDNVNLKNILQISTAFDESQFVGLVIKTSVKGFGGDIEMLIGIDSNGIINSYHILTSAETAGLGDKINIEEFKNQFSNKRVDERFITIKTNTQNSNEIQAITGATISSKAVVLAVNSAVDAYNIVINSNLGGVR